MPRATRFRRPSTLSLLLALAGLVGLLAACAPAAALFAPPTVTLREGARLERLEPPGVGGGAAVFVLPLELANPNAFGLRLAGLDGGLFVDGTRAADARFRGGLVLPARGSAPLTLEVRVPLGDVPALLAELAGLAVGEPTRLRLDGTLALDVLGRSQTLPTVTLVDTTVQQPLRLEPPAVRIDPDASSLRLEGLTLRATVGLELANPLPVGYLLRSPELTLTLAGRPVARAEVPPTPVEAFGEGRLRLAFDVPASELGAALLARLQGGGGVELALGGELALEVPGVLGSRVRVAELARGVLP